MFTMKHLLLTTIATVLMVGCGPSMSIHKAVLWGDIEVVKQHLAVGTDVNAKDDLRFTPLVTLFQLLHKNPLKHKENCDFLYLRQRF